VQIDISTRKFIISTECSSALRRLSLSLKSSSTVFAKAKFHVHTDEQNEDTVVYNQIWLRYHQWYQGISGDGQTKTSNTGPRTSAD